MDRVRKERISSYPNDLDFAALNFANAVLLFFKNEVILK